jgi:hypothetical protein
MGRVSGLLPSNQEKGQNADDNYQDTAEPD